MEREWLIEQLEKYYGEYACGLDFGTPYQLLVATILSAQCTDERVNQVTPALFSRFPDPESMAAVTPAELEPWIASVNFYHNKAIHLVEASRMIVSEFSGEVPGTMEELTRLPGVGRKTANVVLANAMGVPAIAVDTHVFRVSHRLGLSQGKDPAETEQDLMRFFPEDKWSAAHHWLIWHGRKICKARKPLCAECPFLTECPYEDKV